MCHSDAVSCLSLNECAVTALAIDAAGAKIFTGHQDGKIRVWKVSVKNPGVHKRAGTLLSLKEILKSSIKPSNYIEVKRQRSLWIKHSDAVSCLSLNEEHGLLYGLAHGGVLKAHGNV
ncbi:hypothetical protein GOBAR_AA09903 [Gossypium barbadense]|uniref:Uncharacterized protein n=1 Tax=Gossypium barbadense TaxID=3634 RepID=A0A2P5Y578_GOSBA|nr:hypothetical protein GOBAR_AA09903 [Gossypium barbadense]